MGAKVESLEQARPSITPSITRNRTYAARLFGYDIFISFALGLPPRGTRSYASDLVRRLRELDFTVFFSEDEAPVGNQLDSTLRKALLRSHVLVVVANRETLEDPRWIRTEVEEFRKAHPDRPVVPINVGGALQDAELSASVHKWLGHQGTIWVDESQAAIDGGLTSDEVVNRLATAPRGRKAHQRWRVTVSIVFGILALLVVGLGIATWQVGIQWINAKEQLATNYWSQAVRAKKSDDRLRAAHFFAKSAKELGPVLSYASFTAQFVMREQKASEVLSQIRTSLLNIHVDSHKILLGHVLQHEGAVTDVIFSQDGQRILTWSDKWSDNRTARLWQVKDETPISWSIRHEKEVNGAVFNHDGQRLLTWSEDGTARLWQAMDATPIGQPMRHEKRVDGAVFSEDERWVLTWSDDGTARLWQAKDATPIGQPMRHKGEVNGAVFSRDGQWVLTWSDDDTARLWQAKEGTPVGRPMQHDGDGILRAAFSPDGQRVLTQSRDGTARLWQAKDGTPIGQPMPHKGEVNGAVFSRDGQRVLTWSKDGTARLWHAKDAAPVGQAMQHDNRVYGGIFNPDEQRVLTWSKDGTARLWQANDGTPVGRPMQHDARVSGAAFSQDGQRVLTWSADGTAGLWQAKDGMLIGQPMRHEERVEGAVFNQGEQRVLTWSDEGMAVRLWEAKDGASVGPPMRHDNTVLGAAFSQDGQRVLTWSEDGTARLWQAKDGTPVGRPMQHEEAVLEAIFSPDGQRVLTQSRDGTARVWNVEADYDFPTEGIPLLVEILTGTTMDDFGNVGALDPQGWNERREQYVKLAEKHLKACEFETVNLYKTQKQLWGVSK